MARPTIFQPRERVRQRAAASDIVGRFRSGYQIDGKPNALSEWRVTSGDPEVMDAVIDYLGDANDGVQEWEARGEDNLEVFTNTAEVSVLLKDITAIDARMLIWPKRGKTKDFVCGGVAHEFEKGKPYECTDGDWTTRAEHDEQDHVCEPAVKIRFRLADDPDLGLFEFQTGSWSMASVIGEEIGALMDIEEADGLPARATLGLELVEYTTKDGKDRRFTKPVLTVHGPAEEAE